MTKCSELLNFIFLLRSKSKTTDKISVLNQLSKYDELIVLKYFQYVFDKIKYIYGIKDIPKKFRYKIEDHGDEDFLIEDLFVILENLSNRKYNKKEFEDLIESLPNVAVELIHYVLKRDIKAKINYKIINKVFGRVITVPIYMRCESSDHLDRIKYPALIQTKEDGIFVNFIVDVESKSIEMLTRNFQKYSLIPLFFTENLFTNFPENLPSKFVIHGELLVLDEQGKIMNRSEGNGKLNSLLHYESTIDTFYKKISDAKTPRAKNNAQDKLLEFQDEIKYIVNNTLFVVWDFVRYDDWINLRSDEITIDRFKNVQKFVDLVKNNRSETNNEIRLIEYDIVESENEAMKFYQDKVQRGLEGAVIKNLDAPWVDGENRFGIVKMKGFKECDLKIVGFNYGTPGTEFEKGIGSLICESSDSKIRVNVSGLTRELRGFERVDPNDSSKGIRLIEGFDPNSYIGKIAAVKFNYVIKGENEETYSLYLPSVIEIRDPFDKNEADSFEKIMEIDKGQI